jgi:hypothetical protein
MKVILAGSEAICSGQHYYEICMSDPLGLWGFFIWSQTRQGRDYWKERCTGDKAMDDSDRLYLTLVLIADKTGVREFILSPAVCARIQPSF